MTGFKAGGRAGVRLLALLGAGLLGGCTTLGYYAQSVRGQMDLLCRAEPIERLLTDPATAPDLARQLRKVGALRSFAAEHLALPGDGSYRDYVEVDREALVWAVVATGEFSLEPREWCFPVVGCASYRGYFRRATAERYAGGLRDQGLDVAVEPVPAYSTLGWFDDPVPSTVIHWADDRLAGLIFHELAHQRLYLPGDTAFNEAYATVVEEQGVARWLALRPDAEVEHAYRLRRERERRFLDLLESARARLRTLYRGPAPAAAKRSAKAEVFARLRADYAALKARWGNYPGYEWWFARPLNNAHLAAVATYHRRVPALRRLFAESQADFGRFHAAAEALAGLPAARRERELDRLSAP